MKPDAPLRFTESPLQESLLPGPIAWEWIIGATVAICAIAGLLLVQRFRTRKTPAIVDPGAAFKKALRRLDSAAELPPREAATEASFAIRGYLCAVMADPSLFETHEEFLERHPSISNMAPETVTKLTETLKRLAEIKYRKNEETADSSSLLEQSRELLMAIDHNSAA